MKSMFAGTTRFASPAALALAVVALATSACTGQAAEGDEALGTESSDLTSGVAEPAAAGQLMVFRTFSPSLNQDCSAVLISPRVLLTSPTCILDAAEKNPGPQNSVVLEPKPGQQDINGTDAKGLAVAGVHFDIGYGIDKNPHGEHTPVGGMGLVILQSPHAFSGGFLWNSTPLTSSLIGEPVAVWGYGPTKAAPLKTGVARFENSTLSALVSGQFLQIANPIECTGDIGGAVYQRVGREAPYQLSLIGINVGGDSQCKGNGAVRVDVYSNLIRTFL